MLIIRLQRTGRTHDPHFRVVVCEHTIGPKAGKYLEKLGSYNPKTKERTLDKERVKHWISMGAKTSDTMNNMLVEAGVIKEKKINVLWKKKVVAKLDAIKKEAHEKSMSEKAKNAPKDLPAQAEEIPQETPVA